MVYPFRHTLHAGCWPCMCAVWIFAQKSLVDILSFSQPIVEPEQKVKKFLKVSIKEDIFIAYKNFLSFRVKPYLL